MGFLLAPLGVAMLYASVVGFRLVYKQDWTGLYEAITGFGLGGSAIALFGRVGGGIYTKVGLGSRLRLGAGVGLGLGLNIGRQRRHLQQGG